MQNTQVYCLVLRFIWYYQYFQVLNKNEVESYFIIQSETGYLAQFDLLNIENISWERLFAAINQISKTIKISNIDDRLTEKVSQLNKIGLDNYINQYEMEMYI